MLKHRLLATLSILVLASMILSACAVQAPAPSAAPAEGEVSWWRTAAESAGCVA